MVHLNLLAEVASRCGEVDHGVFVTVERDKDKVARRAAPQKKQTDQVHIRTPTHARRSSLALCKRNTYVP